MVVDKGNCTITVFLDLNRSSLLFCTTVEQDYAWSFWFLPFVDVFRGLSRVPTQRRGGGGRIREYCVTNQKNVYRGAVASSAGLRSKIDSEIRVLNWEFTSLLLSSSLSLAYVQGQRKGERKQFNKTSWPFQTPDWRCLAHSIRT